MGQMWGRAVESDGLRIVRRGEGSWRVVDSVKFETGEPTGEKGSGVLGRVESG